MEYDYINTLTLQQVKEELGLYNISTATPDLTGNNRANELRKRLRDYHSSNNNAKKQDVELNTFDFKELSMVELRSRLTLLGENTTTPGLVGEDRRQALMKRLVQSICREDEEELQPVVMSKKNTSAPPSQMHRSPPVQEVAVAQPAVRPPTPEDYHMTKMTFIHLERERLVSAEKVVVSKLAATKKIESSMTNKRAGAIANRWTCAPPDSAIGAASKALTEVEVETHRVTALQHAGGKSKKCSSMLVDAGASMHRADRLLLRLDALREDRKQAVQQLKAVIREEEESHAAHGLQAERDVTAEIQSLNFARTKIRKRLDHLSLFESSPNLDIPHEFREPIPYDPTPASTHTSHIGGDLERLAKPSSSRASHQPKGRPPSPAHTAAGRLAAGRRPPSPEARGASPLRGTVTVERPGSHARRSSPDNKENSHSGIKRHTQQQQQQHGPSSETSNQISKSIEPDKASRAIHESNSSLKPNFRAPPVHNPTNAPAHVPAPQDEDTALQMRTLREHSLVLSDLGDLQQAEDMYLRALELDPCDIVTLDALAMFLHRKKGDLLRSESFYRRAVQTVIPSLLEYIDGLQGITVPYGGDGSLARTTPVKHIVRLLCNYSNFLRRAKGDLELSLFTLRKAVELSPNNAHLIGTFAHQLAEEDLSRNMEECDYLFSKALHLDPKDIDVVLWYAKMLRKTNRLSETEVLFHVALDLAKLKKAKVQATVICNYAVFVFKNKNNIQQAKELFEKGLASFPNHKGLTRNYQALIKALRQDSSPHHQDHQGHNPLSLDLSSMPIQESDKELLQEALNQPPCLLMTKLRCTIDGVNTKLFVYMFAQPDSAWEYQTETLPKPSNDTSETFVWPLQKIPLRIEFETKQQLCMQIFDNESRSLIGECFFPSGFDLKSNKIGDDKCYECDILVAESSPAIVIGKCLLDGVVGVLKDDEDDDSDAD